MRERFVEAVISEAEARKNFFKNTGSSVSTLYIGGGTPSVLLPEQLEAIVHGITDSFGLLLRRTSRDADNICSNCIEEFTIEVNPDDITPQYAEFLVDLGVNRVSMGVQSFIDTHLKWMNRRHSASGAEMAYGILREAGIRNISLDLIFGYSLLSEKEWEYNIDKITELAPEHISAYQMSIEPGSVLGKMCRKGEYAPPSDEECGRQYAMLQKKLSKAGYAQYEISNFARQGRESVHNSSYWSGAPYIGLGPAAHSFTGKCAPDGARRLWNTPSVKKYCAHYANLECKECNTDNDNLQLSGIADYEILTEENIFNEAIMLGLRRTCGLSLENLDEKYLSQIKLQLNSLIKQEALVKEGDNIRIPANRLFVSDSIIRELFV